MTPANNPLYTQVVDVTMSYLGPAAERFISRQIETHLKKNPEDLVVEDLEILVDWIKVAIALLTEDQRIVDDFTKSLMALAENSPAS